MGLREIVGKLIPSFRARDAIIDAVNSNSRSILRRINELEKRIADLDQKNEYLFFCLQHLDHETDLETKKRVFLQMQKASGVTADFQMVSNYILRRIKEICDENNIHFSLSYGTLLGAVRHHGFIPWDDDVDIDVFRGDLDRLEEAINADGELEMRRYYRYSLNKDAAGYVTKVKLRESNQFFVDVFQNDTIRCEKGKEEECRELVTKLSKQFHAELFRLFNDNGFADRLTDGSRIPQKDDILDPLVKILEKKYYDKLYQSVGSLDHFTHYCLGFERGFGFWNLKIKAADDVLPFQDDSVEFEGVKYGAYKNCEKMLNELYGDIWSLPGDIAPGHSKEHTVYSEKDLEIIRKVNSFFDRQRGALDV